MIHLLALQEKCMSQGHEYEGVELEIGISCTGCGLCVRACPTDAIRGTRGQTHVIDQRACIHCGACVEACPSECIAPAE